MTLHTRLAGLVGALVATAALAGTPPSTSAKARWNGGKHSPPVQIDAQLEPGSAPVVRLRVTPGTDCANLVTEIRGVDGVTLDAPTVMQHPSCAKDGTVEQRVTAHPPANGVGYAAVTVRLEIGGRPVSVTRAVAVAAPGAVRTKKLPSSEAQVKQGPDGERTVILRSKQ